MKPPSPSASLATWLGWLESLHPKEIDLGLARVGQVADRCGLRPIDVPVILVGGTNGKGSVVEILSLVYQQSGYRVGTYTSPHISVFNERICVDRLMASDIDIVRSLAVIEAQRNGDPLTYFEYTTLAAMHLFLVSQCDVVILEVGLGGRLDATNLWDCDCAVVTSIAIDHEAYLGNRRSVIATEKAAIGRRGKPLVIGEQHPPSSLSLFADKHGLLLHHINESDLPHSALPGQHQRRNAACAVLAVNLLQDRLIVSAEAIDFALQNVTLAGRFERRKVAGETVILDVAHNPAAARCLNETIGAEYPNTQVYAIFSMLADKDIAGVVQALVPVVTKWYCVPLAVPRAAELSLLVDSVSSQHNTTVLKCQSIDDAWNSALVDCRQQRDSELATDSVILVAGSFYTLAAIEEYWCSESTNESVDEHE